MRQKTQKTKGKAKKIVKPQPKPEKQPAKREKVAEFIEVLLPAVRVFLAFQGKPLGYKEGVKNVHIFDYYRHTGKGTVFKSFQSWKKEGFQVKKGEKALLCYGSKVEKERDLPQAEGQEGTTEKYEFFPIAYVFSDLQVKNTNEHEEGTGNA
jgi:hypothetical protein